MEGGGALGVIVRVLVCGVGRGGEQGSHCYMRQLGCRDWEEGEGGEWAGGEGNGARAGVGGGVWG